MKKEKYGIDKKFTFIIVILVFIPILIGTMVFFQYKREMILQEKVQRIHTEVTDQKKNLKKIMEICSITSKTFLENRELKKLLLDIKDKKKIATRRYVSFYRDSMPNLEAIINSNPYVYQVRVYARSDQFPEMMPILYHKNENAIWSMKDNREIWYFDSWNTSDDEQEKEPVMSLVNDIYDDFGEKIGTLEVTISMKEYLFDIYNTKGNMWSCFIRNSGDMYGTSVSIKKLKSVISDENMNLKEQNHFYFISKNKKNIMVIQPVDELDGTYIKMVSVEDEYQNIFYLQLKVFGVIVFLFFIITILVKITVHTLLKKFYDILYVIRNIQRGNLDDRVEHIGRDEMGELGFQINRMLDKIQVLMKEKIEYEILVKNTEIKALQNQINVHFIYNVLETIKMMAEIEEKYDISDAITSLGELLRYNMRWVSSNVTIREEMTYIENYIQLMNLRYDFTVVLSVQMEDEIYDQRIPKMSLQPIIENAICHGIVELGEDATIYIHGKKCGNDYDISITDSGIGMNEEMLSFLEKKMKGGVEVEGGNGNGIGLKNVHDRIQMQFGEQYGLAFYSKEGCFTKVRIRLPIRYE